MDCPHILYITSVREKGRTVVFHGQGNSKLSKVIKVYDLTFSQQY